MPNTFRLVPPQTLPPTGPGTRHGGRWGERFASWRRVPYTSWEEQAGGKGGSVGRNRLEVTQLQPWEKLQTSALPIGYPRDAFSDSLLPFGGLSWLSLPAFVYVCLCRVTRENGIRVCHEKKKEGSI